MSKTSLHDILDWNYGPDGINVMLKVIDGGADVNESTGEAGETPLHVATRRRRKDAIENLLDRGADIDGKTAGGKTAYAHAARRGFNEIVKLLETRGCDTTLNDADRLAVAVVNGRLDDARSILTEHPDCVRTRNSEEDRLLADVAGRNESEPVALLIEAGADLSAAGLDGGTPLHQSAWFGQPQNTTLLIEAGAPLNLFDPCHGSSPLHWGVHGARHSGGAEDRQEAYYEVVKLLLDAGSSLQYPDQPESDDYLRRLHADATPSIAELLPSL